MPPRAASRRFTLPGGSVVSLATLKHAAIAWLVVRVLSSGFFGRAVTAAAAGALAYGCRQLPGLVPAPFADSLKKLDALTADSTNRLSLSLAVDAIGAAIGAVEPRWLKAFVGGAGWGPVCTFLIQYVYQIPPLTALAAAEESGYVNWFRVVPTATIGWLLHQKFVDEAGLRAGLNRLRATVGL